MTDYKAGGIKIIHKMIEKLEELEPKDVTSVLARNARTHIDEHSEDLAIMLVVARDIANAVQMLGNVQDVFIPEEKKKEYLDLAETLVKLKSMKETKTEEEMLQLKLLLAVCPSETDMDLVLQEMREMIVAIVKEKNLYDA